MEAEENIKYSKPFFHKLVKWVFILIFISGLFGYVGFKYSLSSLDELKSWMGEVNIAKSTSQNHAPTTENSANTNSADQQIIVTETTPAQNPVVPTPAEIAPAPQNISNDEVLKLKENQKYFALYLAARDLRDVKNNPEKFTNELRYFMVISDGNTEIAGKLDILRLSAETGLQTISKLRDDFAVMIKNVEKEQAKGVWQSIKYSLSNLVRVTKIKPDADAQTPREIQVRVNLLLAQNDLNGAIREAQKLGPKADEWVRQANNLARVYEITDYLVDYARNKIKF